ncbi:uncharacterized protein N7473_004505 [Penicillium subrubescens]|uniref:Uncharacterized protein n=1 Tax=Penicillium subrubescens TaxID=1316194 RepID=A0A1Q5UN86_9EURO|nr:uncharacterized protein N7473_004505 [Penicillium subrubescens]KAJ5900435.1 hypothetical protein N7473_004505 [Penicillium subrubescens]OKP13945.1 hypothetical protein PENSUB_352 [Penicillium subrubescens]
MNDMEHEGFVVPGDLIRVQVDWVIASEASWTVNEKNIVLDDTSILRPQHQGMERTYELLWNQEYSGMTNYGLLETMALTPE